MNVYKELAKGFFIFFLLLFVNGMLIPWFVSSNRVPTYLIIPGALLIVLGEFAVIIYMALMNDFFTNTKKRKKKND